MHTQNISIAIERCMQEYGVDPLVSLCMRSTIDTFFSVLGFTPWLLKGAVKFVKSGSGADQNSPKDALRPEKPESNIPHACRTL